MDLWKLPDFEQVARYTSPTHAGHNIMIDNAPVVIQAIRMMVDAVRAGQHLAQGVTH